MLQRTLNDRCASVVRLKGGGREARGWRPGVELIKAAHLQRIKEPLSSISPNLLKHAAQDMQS